MLDQKIRARLDEHHMFRGYCIGCVRTVGGPHHECAVAREHAALRAVLDYAEDEHANRFGIRRVIAAHLGVTESDPCGHDSTVEVTRYADPRHALLCERCGAEVDGGPR